MTENDFTIYKADEDQRLVFGWASVAITVDGEELEDRQHDVIDPDDLEEAAYEYVLNFRDTGEEHLPGYRKKGKLVESCVFTPDKQRAMGIPEGVLPVGWWIGFKIEDESTWQRVKNGTYKMFSIEGKANREEIQKAENPTGCGVLVVKDGKILTANRIENGRLGRVGGPGGHIEPGETPEKAARREAYEEFGILCDDLQPLGIQDGGKYGTSAVFMCSKFSGNPRTDDEEMTGPKWIEVSKITEENTYPPFMQSLDLLPEEAKTIRTAKSFSEVRKFNPFHDSLGKFSSASGMRTYSANPKTRAGQMAIARSSVNHGHVLNVHRESKGESIGQNQQWITSGKFNGAPVATTGHYGGNPKKNPGPNVKPKATANTNTQPQPKQPAQQHQNAPQNTSQSNGSLAADVANVKITATQKNALRARGANGKVTQTTKVADDHYQDRVDGQDISATFDIKKMNTKKDPIDAIAEAQGWNKAPTVTNDRDVFDKAAMQAGRVMIRTVHASNVTGETANEVATSTMTNGNYSLGGSGGTALGTGRYFVDTNIKGSQLSTANIKAGQQASYWYGDKQMMATVHPNARIATPTQGSQLQSQFFNLSPKQRARFGNDVNTYIASKGYDGVKWNSDLDPTAYTTMFNISAMIFYGGVADNY